MNRYSKVQSSVWTESTRFRKLNMIQRYIYLYFLSCPHGNSAGIFHVIPAYAIYDLGCSLEDYYSTIEVLSKVNLISYDRDNDIVFLHKYLKFNPITNPKHAKGTSEIANKYVNSSVYADFYREIEVYCQKYTDYFNRPIIELSEDYGYTDTDTDTNTETDTDTDTETDIPENKKTSTPHEEIRNLYNNICTSLPRCTSLSDKRKNKLRVLFKNFDFNLEKIESVFKKAEESDFLSGRNGKWTSCNFDWLINYNNAIKVLEGNYDNKQNNNKSSPNKFNNYEQREYDFKAIEQKALQQMMQGK